MGRRKKRRTRSDSGGRRVNIERRVEANAFVRANQYTAEGHIERLGDFAAGANRAKGWRRYLAKLLIIALFIVPFVFGVVTTLVQALR